MSNTLFRLKRSAVKGKSPTTSNIELGELAINTNDGRLFFKTTDSASSSSIVTLRQISGGTGITETNGELSITNTGVGAGTYGSTTTIPVLTINAQGQIDSAGTVTVAGVSGLSFDSSNATLTLATADGGSFNARIGLQHFSTSDLSEGTNLYYTTARADSAFDDRLAIKTTDNLTQGSTNLYYATSLFNTDLATKTTDDLTQGSTNLYYDSATTITTARNAIGVSGLPLTYNAATGTLGYTEVSYAGFDSDFALKTTNDLTEGGSTNLYFNNARSRAAVSATDNGGDGSFSYDSSTGTFSFTGPSASEVRAHFSAGTGIGITNGQISTSITQYTDADARGTVSVNDAGGDGSLSYDSSTGIFTYTGPSASEVRAHLSAGGDLSYDSATGRYSFTQRTDSEVRGLVSVTDSGGDGSLSYNNSTGVITYTGPSASETRAHFSGGTGVTLTNGEIAIGQSVGTTDDVTFGKATLDSAHINTQIKFTPTEGFPSGTQVGGELWFDSDPSKGLSFTTINSQGASDVTINIGQEEVIYVQNKTGATLTNGTVVELDATDSATGYPTVNKTNATMKIEKAIGVCTQDIPNNSSGYITTQGIVRDVNTGYPFSEGDTLFICMMEPGTYVRHDITPDAGYPYQLGTVLTSDSSEGTILVAPIRRHWDGARFSGDVVIDDALTTSGTVTSKGITFDGTVPAYAEGTIFYDSANGAIAFKNDVPEITMQIGQEDWVRVYNSSGSQINNGQCVYVTGANNNVPTIDLADATDDAKVHAIGLATHNIANGSYGYVTTKGVVNDIDTSLFSPGNKVHVGTTPGGFSTIAPTFPNYAVDLGYVLTADSAGAGGSILVDIIDHTFEVIRTTGNGRFDGDVTIAGNLNILGTETTTAVQSLSVGDAFIYVGAGDTITTIFGTGQSGLNDLTLKEYYEGDSDKTYFVKITGTDSAGDTIQWGFDSADGIGEFTPLSFDSDGGVGPTSWNLGDDRTLVPLRHNIKATFIAATGHTLNNYWKGNAQPVNRDIGIFGNYNTASEPYSHSGIFRDIDDERWKFVGRYDPEIEGNVNTGHSSFELADVQANRFHGDVTGDITGNASTATLLETGRNIALTGEVTATGVSFNGSQNITLTTDIATGVINNDNINASAGIVDTKLATISTTGKVQNSATSATSANNGSTIVLRDASGNFTAGTITANLTGTVSSISNHDSAIRNLFSVDNSGLGYDSATGQFSLLNPGVDSASTLALFSAANTGTGHGTLSYSNGEFSFAKVTDTNIRSAISAGTGITVTNGEIATTITQYTDTLARGAISHTNTGTGFGSIGYNDTTGTINYNKVTSANIRSVLSVTGNLSYDSATGQFSSSETYSTPSELLTAVKTVDGSGSGLDADTLDGQQGSHYRINVYNSAGTLLN